MNTKDKKILFKEKYGPWALVAGASYGLGSAYSEALAQHGLNLVLLARGKEQLEAEANRLREHYAVEVMCYAIDLADYEKAKSIITNLNLPIGLLVYNAAFAPIGLFENISEEQLNLTIAVNVKTPLLLAKLMSIPMIQRGKGGIVLMSSLAGGQGSSRLQTYAATKAFNAILAEGLWKELKPRGIDVIGCIAGAILTPNYQKAEKTKSAPGAISAEKVAKKTLMALGKKPIIIPGTVNKIAHFLMTRLLPRRISINIMKNKTGGLS
ncbi:MAG: SDR family NAD(P)-dependent oxidoreductase [Bacteroidales bacterium]|jgi:short-subunit dehydrogenase|nr:SDR family NAD(P)-dependent oxidoreductase [Bacteroidales bacterium]